MNKEENIVKWIKGQRISWLGNLERMEEDRMSKKIFIQELERMRRRGRPKKGWKEEVEKDLQVLRVRRRRELVIGKNGTIFFDRPKPTAGCRAIGRRRNVRTGISETCLTLSTYVKPKHQLFMPHRDPPQSVVFVNL